MTSDLCGPGGQLAVVQPYLKVAGKRSGRGRGGGVTASLKVGAHCQTTALLFGAV